MSNSTLERVGYCGSCPYYLSKAHCLEQRDLLRPNVWAAVYAIACAPNAVVTRLAGFGSPRVEVVYRSITVIVALDGHTDFPVVITVFATGNPADLAGLLLEAARTVPMHSLVALDDRVWGWA